MALQNRITVFILLLALTIQLSIQKSVKPNPRPVHEVVNEQARSEEKVRIPHSPGALPYGNPLAGNSQQKARIHAQNQQAMFNAERIRQHTAQLQRWTKAPPQVDSYMRAYHESQETHQLALEQQQTSQKVPSTTPATKPRRISSRIESKSKPRGRSLLNPDMTKITKEDAVVPDKNRNHRSHGSGFNNYLQARKFKNVLFSPGPTYDVGVTIKPNGNLGLSGLINDEEKKLFTEAIASKHVYSKPYSHLHTYQPPKEIDHLKSLLHKNPEDQASELNDLIKSAKYSYKETPLDLLLGFKDHSNTDLQNYFSPDVNLGSFVSGEKDHVPITEDIDDIEDPNKHMPKPYTHTAVPSPTKHTGHDTTTTKTSNYYKVEVSSEVVTGYNPLYKEKHAPKPTHQTYQPIYEQLYTHPTYSNAYHQEGKEDQSERYLHHNAQFKGIQHLNPDGTGVSAYGDDSIHYAANYEFGYRVKDPHSGNDFGHHEAKKGDKTKGGYHVLLPDGRVQKVKYLAGPDGFHADISYDHLQYKH